MTDKTIVLISGPINKHVLPPLERDGRFEIRKPEKGLHFTAEELKSKISDAQILIVAYQSVITREILSAGERLGLVIQPFVGYENVDVDACTALGIPFCNTASIGTEAVAELGMALVFAAYRNLPQNCAYAKSGGWQRRGAAPFLFGQTVSGSVMGILGLGHIGLRLAELAQGCGMTVLYHNRRRHEAAESAGMTWVTTDELYKAADIVADVLPLTAETKHFVDRAAFRKMKDSALFLNIGRGDTVDTTALTEALRTGEIAKAALDVIDIEPLPPQHALYQMDNVIITPHIGGMTRQSWAAKGNGTAANIISFCNGQGVRDCVNGRALGIRENKKVRL
ncbi:2-hydroxyacid dehydrogenase [Megasphaera vaginalis (ex Srinivasan et al. 2021)]|uniref:Glyoxylate/hydroxypyruvate reductase B n=1 Tax=Megasphaera vaginalis (ex Srinivasan et al. 2021) TaxID=1111454 RepID=U7UT65_9FIRM|nr:NAD(P)-dependent oxidoreductase [Megasphaera vaginalis (ex Srinivasan et al. 2021)]ERT62496.1 4-phosphoerythronate dehydrogenase [Megasphaera vaginalis (ex Srinivasan et al. 2021)]